MKSVLFHASVEKPVADSVRARLSVEAASAGLEVRERGPVDAVVVLGGDGTFLRAAHEYAGLPILGLNLGGLGYLSCVEEKDAAAALSCLAQGRYRISERRMLSVNGSFPALNDIVVVREQSGHSARLDLAADGRPVTRYMADGLIFATPTGSTAYSLAAGGPVLMPDSGSFVVTPLNPHALGVRPLVVRDSVRFTVTVCARTSGNGMKVGVYADGDAVLSLAPGDSIEIAKSERTAKLVELEGYDPYEVLARKLGWSGSNVR